MTSRRSACLFVLSACSVLTGCKGDAAPSGASATAGPTASAATAPIEKPAGFDLTATAGGKPVDFRFSMAFRRPHSDAYHVWVSTHGHDCGEAAKNGTRLTQGEVYASFVVASPLAKQDKEAGWLVSDTYYEGSSLMSTATRAKVDAPNGGPIRVTLPKMTMKDFHEKAPLEMEGTIVAKDCGVIEAPDIGAERGKPRPQAELDLTIEGEKIAVLAANLDGDTLVLANRPLSCQESFSYADVTLLLKTDGKSAGVQGARVGSITLSETSPPIEIAIADPAADPVEATITGAFKHEIWAGEIKGKVSAARCKK